MVVGLLIKPEVTPLAGVWIEIVIGSLMDSTNPGHASCRRVD